MQVHLAGLRTGPYRIVIHANGNCTSPNAFSAGPPWIPAGASPQTIAQMQAAVMVGDNAFSLVQRISGVRLDGGDPLTGKSVVVHAGSQGSLEAQPGVPNDRVACGVIGTAGSVF
jgi:Cu/Zn superoxide dismutase